MIPFLPIGSSSVFITKFIWSISVALYARRRISGFGSAGYYSSSGGVDCRNEFLLDAMLGILEENDVTLVSSSTSALVLSIF